MTTSSSDAKPASFDAADYLRRITIERASPYDLWTQSTGLPVHEGYFIEDVRAIDLGWWEERQCYAAFLKLAGQEGITEARVSEIPPGRTLPPMKFALDEIVYVIEGSGLTTVSVENKDPKKTFEWTKHSLFMIPRNITFEMTNAQGARPARLLHYNYLPVSMSLMPDPSAYFNAGNLPVLGRVVEGDAGLYGAAQRVERPNRPDGRPGMAFWIGNFFPDMKAWDKLVAFRGRGAGGHAVWVRYPGATMTNHMSVFPSRTYKKAHRHGPGVVIVIPDGEGFSVMWPEGKEKIVIPWHEGSVFVPPNRWFHQHFNVGAHPARYLAFHGPPSLSSYGYGERIADPSDQIEYPDEEPWIREKFEAELAGRGLATLMPSQAYEDKTFEWDYDEEE